MWGRPAPFPNLSRPSHEGHRVVTRADAGDGPTPPVLGRAHSPDHHQPQLPDGAVGQSPVRLATDPAARDARGRQRVFPANPRDVAALAFPTPRADPHGPTRLRRPGRVAVRLRRPPDHGAGHSPWHCPARARTWFYRSRPGHLASRPFGSSTARTRGGPRAGSAGRATPLRRRPSTPSWTTTRGPRGTPPPWHSANCGTPALPRGSRAMPPPLAATSDQEQAPRSTSPGFLIAAPSGPGSQRVRSVPRTVRRVRSSPWS